MIWTTAPAIGISAEGGVSVSVGAEQLGMAVPTRYWHRLEDGRIQCDVCPRFCKLQEGQQGRHGRQPERHREVRRRRGAVEEIARDAVAVEDAQPHPGQQQRRAGAGQAQGQALPRSDRPRCPRTGVP